MEFRYWIMTKLNEVCETDMPKQNDVYEGLIYGDDYVIRERIKDIIQEIDHYVATHGKHPKYIMLSRWYYEALVLTQKLKATVYRGIFVLYKQFNPLRPYDPNPIVCLGDPWEDYLENMKEINPNKP